MRSSALSALWILTAMVCVVVLVLTTTIAEPLPPLPIDPFWLAWVGLPVVGAFILVKAPGNTVGAIVLVIGVCAALSAGSNLAAFHGLGRPNYLVLINQLVFAPLFVLLPMLILVFPSGRLPSSRWRSPVIGAIGIDVILIIWFGLRPVDYSFDNIDFYPNPLGVDAFASFDPIVIPALQWALVGFAAAVIVHAIRHYRTATVQERLQVKWVVAPALITPLLFVAGISLEDVSAELGNLLVIAAIVGGGNGIAVGIGVAVLRYRLYGIDRIISRTVSYGVVLVLLGLVVMGLVSLFALFLPSDDPLVVAVSTLVVFALFSPLRRRVQSAVDRRFNRSRYDATVMVENLTSLLRDKVDSDAVVDDWMGIVGETVQPTAAGVWIREEAKR